MQTNLEKNIEKRGSAVAKRFGAWPIKLAIIGGRGWPDHTIVAPGGRIAFIEYKRPGGEFQPLQKYVHKRLKFLGFRVEVITSNDQVDEFFEEFFNAAAPPR